MSRAALQVYRALREHGTQQPVLAAMQTREELYAVLGYHDYELKLDELFARADKPARTARKRPPVRKGRRGRT
jgi:methylisocitrate lyase